MTQISGTDFLIQTKLWDPIGLSHQHDLRLGRVVGLDADVELVGAAHAFVHGVVQGEDGFLAGLKCRRTDDSIGRSAPLYEFDLGFAQKLEGFVPYIAQPESGLDRGFKLYVSGVEGGLSHGQPWRPPYFRDKIRLGLE
jgi:hypothetical protein